MEFTDTDIRRILQNGERIARDPFKERLKALLAVAIFVQLGVDIWLALEWKDRPQKELPQEWSTIVSNDSFIFRTEKRSGTVQIWSAPSHQWTNLGTPANPSTGK